MNLLNKNYLIMFDDNVYTSFIIPGSSTTGSALPPSIEPVLPRRLRGGRARSLHAVDGLVPAGGPWLAAIGQETSQSGRCTHNLPGIGVQCKDLFEELGLED